MKIAVFSNCRQHAEIYFLHQLSQLLQIVFTALWCHYNCLPAGVLVWRVDVTDPCRCRVKTSTKNRYVCLLSAEGCPKSIEFAANQHDFDYGNVYATTESDNTLLNPRRK